MKRANVVRRLTLLAAAAVLATAGCSSGGAAETAVQADESDDLQPAAAGDFVVVTADGETWVGRPPHIRILGPLPDGTPAVAEVGIAVASPRGVLLGLHFELEPETLLDTPQWQIALDGEKPTRPGLGVLSYGSESAPRSARTGHLSASVDGTVLKGTFGAKNDDVPSLSSATFRGRYVVECLVPERGATAPIEGSVGASAGPGAFALRLDEKLESDFCARFRGL